MIGFLPIKFYTPIYYHFLLLIVIFTFINTQTIKSENNLRGTHLKYFGLILFAFIIIYMGLRPINGVFVDMGTYANIFKKFQLGNSSFNFHDPIFQAYMMFSAKVMTVKTFFLVCTLLYVVPLYLVSKKLFKEYWFYAFLFLVCSFSFWAYGVNGIRNGIAGSIFLLGITRDKRIFQIIWVLIAIGFHKSMILPALGYLISQIYKNPKAFIGLWLFCIPLSLISGGFWRQIFAGLTIINDERFSYLTTDANASYFSNVGFRWDFLLYSSTAVFAGWYYIVIKKFDDKIYSSLFSTYVFANAFWILVIRANYSNRFAYLSWFMMALIIVYPLLKQTILVNQYRKIGLILVSYYAFTYAMAIIIK